MRHQFIRRAAALVLALILAAPLTAPVRAAEESSKDILTIVEKSRINQLMVNETAELTLSAKWADGNKPEGKISYEWKFGKSSDVQYVTEPAVTGDGSTVTFKIKGLKERGSEFITLTATYGGGNDSSGGSDASGGSTSGGNDASGGDASGGDASGSSAAASGGRAAAVTVTTEYELKVMDISLAINGSSSVRWTNTTEEADKAFSVSLSGIDVGGTEPQITWTVWLVTPHPGMVVPTISGKNAGVPQEVEGKVSTTVTGVTATVDQQTAGEFYVSAEYTAPNGRKVTSNTVKLTISGIVLYGTGMNVKEKTLDMVVNGSAVLSADRYGDAVDDDVSLEWSSDDPEVVSVMPDAGNLNAWMDGETFIYAATDDGRYSERCKVRVDEDRSALADNGGKGYPASVSDPLILGEAEDGPQVYTALDEICKAKTAANLEYADEVNKIGYGLSYITNLSVPTSQGTLYYDYSTESDTGAGVGYNDRFASKEKAVGSVRSVERLYFVPKPGVTGTVDITFTGIAENRRNFSGIIRVSVGADSGAYQINYRAQAGEPVWFASSDFDAYCQNEFGRTYNYIIFNLPKSSEGVLYYNYVANSGNPVTATTRFTPSGRYTPDDVCFVPSAAYDSKEPVIISFRGADTSGKAISGEVKVSVTQPSTGGDPANVTILGERGKPVALRNSLFNDACKETLGDTLNFVTFTLPDPSEGTLYVNYRSDGSFDSRVTAGTRCYYSGVPGLGSVSFVPASGAAGRVAIPYTGYGAGGASFSGTLYISLDEVGRSTIYYSVVKGGTVTFNASDFNIAGQYAVGSSVSFVIFTATDDVKNELGRLRYRNSSTSTPAVPFSPNADSTTSSYIYYINPSTSSQRGLGRVFFEAAKNKTGTVTFDYRAFSGSPTGSNRKELFSGKVVIRVSSLAPEDVSLSCRTGGDAGATFSRQLALGVTNACGNVMSGSLSYIEITSVPGAKEGRLYYNYSGFGTGMAVMQGDRFYCVGSPSLYQLNFVPFARFAGQAEITYIGYSSDGKEQVSGRILVNVSKTAYSSYFHDLGNAAWAIDSVDYLYRNGTVKGIGDDLFAPGDIVSKGDFTLMLVRAYGLTSSGSVSFSDVPAGSYYADAIRIAAARGVVSGENGNFNPKAPLTRQDAILMIYKTLQVSGKATTNGLAADLSVYHDEGSIAAGAREAMGILVQMGVVEGDGGYLYPRRQLMRSEAAMLLHSIMTL